MASAAVAVAERAALFALCAAAGMACRAADRGATGGGMGGGAGATDASSYPPPFSIAALDRIGIGSQGSTGWTVVGAARADAAWGQGPFARVGLALDLESACFPFEKWQADPPPTGQRWPADCDAFDRNLSVFVDDPSDGPAAPGASAPFEVIHAITPFGGPEHIEVDLTDLANALPGTHRLRVDVGSNSDPQGLTTGSNGGWTVSVRIDVTPGPAPRAVLAAVPLAAARVSAGDPSPTAAWQVPAGAVGGRLEYRTSGHGQGARAPSCLGPAEEFCDRRHQIWIDGALAEDIEPYRHDCQTLCTPAHQGPADGGLDYCQENPCGDMTSVIAPRANWCPGGMTLPFVWEDLPALAIPGAHTAAFEIADIAAGGYWFVSATYYAYGP
jgi:hypothetical protein